MQIVSNTDIVRIATLRRGTVAAELIIGSHKKNMVKRGVLPDSQAYEVLFGKEQGLALSLSIER